MWLPYYELLIGKYKEGIATGKNVVLSFAVLNLFGDKEWVREQLPGVKIVIIDVDREINIKRL